MFNSRHPGPRRVWKGGSEPQFTTSLCRDPVDPVDRVVCSKLVFRVRKALLFYLEHAVLYVQGIERHCLGGKEGPCGHGDTVAPYFQVERSILCLQAREAFQNYPEARGSVFPKYEPVASHGDPFRAQNHRYKHVKNVPKSYKN